MQNNVDGDSKSRRSLWSAILAGVGSSVLSSAVIVALIGGFFNYRIQSVKDDFDHRLEQEKADWQRQLEREKSDWQRQGAAELESKRFSYEILKGFLGLNNVKDDFSRTEAVGLALEMREALPSDAVIILQRLQTDAVKKGTTISGISSNQSQTVAQTGAASQINNDASRTRVVIETKNGNAYVEALKPILKGLRDAGFLRDYNPEAYKSLYAEKEKSASNAMIFYNEGTKELAIQVQGIVQSTTKLGLKVEMSPQADVPGGVIYLYLPY